MAIQTNKDDVWMPVTVWIMVGVLAGWVLGMAAGFEGRQLVFFAILGLGVAWFGVWGLISRSIVKGSGENTDTFHTMSDTPLPPDQAREWLDDFLVKQQKKE